MFEINFYNSDSNYSAQVSPSTKNEYIYIEKGNTGSPGAQGEPGKNGTSSYIHIKYSSVPSPTAEQMTDTISSYVGIYVNDLKTDSDDPTKYQWKELRGAKGDKGDLIVLHVAYANSANGQTDFSLVNSGNMKYIGILANYSSDAVNDYAQYSWSQLKGDIGNSATVEVGTVSTGTAGSSATITNSGDNHNAVLNFKIPKGDKGNTGTITIGNISTLAAGANATVVNTGTNTDAIFDFGIPQGVKGDKGDTGDAATITVGTVLTGESGSSATVTNSGTTKNAVFNMSIPKGDKGEKGDKGKKGDKGDTGDAATIAVGTVSTGAAGSNASVSNSGTTKAAIFDISIPKGDKGDPFTYADLTQEQINTLAKDVAEASGKIDLTPYVKKDGTTPMSYLDVGDRKSGSVVGKYSVAEGGDKAFIGGDGTTYDDSNTASGDYSHAEGGGAMAIGTCSHAEGEGTTASGEASHAGGINTKASSPNQTAIGKYNIEDTSSTNLLIVGNGTSDTTCSNAFTVGTNGDITAGKDVIDSAGNKLSLKANTSDVPTATSKLTNDSGFITKTVSDLTNYYVKSDTYTKSEVSSLISAINSFNIEVVTSLPTTGVEHTLYLVPKTGDGATDVHNEYVWVGSKYELIGNTEVDLSGYCKTADVNTALAQKVNADGTTPMSCLDVGDRKAGSVVGKYSVCEGGDKAYVVGSNTYDRSNTASGDYSHAEGIIVFATGEGSHAEGSYTTASGDYSHAGGKNTTASGDYSHAGGYNTKASSSSQTAIGEYNIEDVEGNNLLIVGNGTSDTARSNAFVVGIDGSATVSTELKCQGITDSETSRTVSISDIQEALYKGVKTIATTDWTNKQTTVMVSLPTSMKLEGNGVSTFISAAPESCADYGKFGVYCSAESGSMLTFTCSKVPTVDLNVNILVQYYSIQV